MINTTTALARFDSEKEITTALEASYKGLFVRYISANKATKERIVKRISNDTGHTANIIRYALMLFQHNNYPETVPALNPNLKNAFAYMPHGITRGDHKDDE